uniref:Uncharacterized protein n=1 Tax=Siphoviridae sp. ctv4j104 TaxID=2826510 RepID=A0A8S5M9S6_9CAUD|nr:MAG TPA: hypothetical protein [Siphoviridae sp. ctv4j104]
MEIEHPGATVIPDALQKYLDMSVMYELLERVSERRGFPKVGTSLFDYMTDEEYEYYNNAIETAIAEKEKHRRN